MSRLAEIEMECREMSIKLEEFLNQLPRNQTCVYSLFPERLWCSERNLISMVACCSSCYGYEPRGSGGVN